MYKPFISKTLSRGIIAENQQFLREEIIFIAVRTIYYIYRGQNKNCLCGINSVFVLRSALPAVLSEREMARSLRVNFLRLIIHRVKRKIKNIYFFISTSYFPRFEPLMGQKH